MPKKSKEAYKTKHGVFDEFTNKALYKLITEGRFTGLKSPVSIGKESNVFSAETKEGNLVIVKIYRLETCDFNIMYDYIKYDPRYMNLKRRKRAVIFSWVQREFRNLMKAREAGVAVPLPIVFKDNIIVEEWVGTDEIAPKLKDLKPDDPEKFLKTTIKYMKKMYKAKLVHADLSGFNILNKSDKPVFIDMSQTTTTEHPQAKEFLVRDCKNIATLFKKWGVDCTQENLYEQITA